MAEIRSYWGLADLAVVTDAEAAELVRRNLCEPSRVKPGIYHWRAADAAWYEVQDALTELRAKPIEQEYTYAHMYTEDDMFEAYMAGKRWEPGEGPYFDGWLKEHNGTR